VDLNTAPRERLLRVPGLGTKTVEKLIAARRHVAIRIEDLARLRVSLSKVLPFIVTADHRPRLLDSAGLRDRLIPATAFAQAAKPVQMSLF
jgi:predicted DNA-binding helix-hairpin-helix protein